MDGLITNPLGVLAVLAVVVYTALRLEARFVTVRSLGAALVGILIGMALSNLRILPGASPAYDFLASTGVSAAVVLILLSIDVRSIRQAGPRMLVAFALGAVGTCVGAGLATVLLSRQIGDETWKLTGQFTGTYIGGINFAALGQALGTSSDLFTAAVAADVILTAMWMVTCLTVPVLLGVGGRTPQSVRSKEASTEDQEDTAPTLARALYESGRSVDIGTTAALVATVASALWLSHGLVSLVPALPQVLWLTGLALAIGQVPAIRRLAGSAMLGNYLLLLFLASNGAQSVVANIVRMGPAVFYFAAITVAVHGLVIFGIGKLMGIDLGTLAVASQANVGGSASAMAIASARGYADRLLPGVAVGLLGYAVGNYAGFGMASLVRGLLSG